jgi:hypothetical protein
MARTAVKQETLDRFAKKVSRRKNRCVEPKNGGPSGYKFAKMIGRMGAEQQIHGSVIRRLRVSTD